MGTVPAVKSACCVWGTFGKSAATAWVSAASHLLGTFFKADPQVSQHIILNLEKTLQFSPHLYPNGPTVTEQVQAGISAGHMVGGDC